MKQVSFRVVLSAFAMWAAIAAISVSHKNIELAGVFLCAAVAASLARRFGGREVDEEIQRQLDEVAARSPHRRRRREKLDQRALTAKKVEEEQADEKLRRLIEEANASSSNRPISSVEVMLGRGARSAEAWVAHVREVTDASRRSFRERTISNEELWSVVSDADADAGARAAAAVALRPTLDEEGKKRLRVASETCESRKLRIALERAADASAEDEELVEALSEIES